MPQFAEDGDSPPEEYGKQQQATQEGPQRHRTARRVVIALLALYTIGLAWGYVRLPWATIRPLAEHGMITQDPGVVYGYAGVSNLQRSYLERRLPRNKKSVTRHVEVSVEWYALVATRVRCNSSSTNSSVGKDTLYICCFGAWLPVYTFSHVIACG